MNSKKTTIDNIKFDSRTEAYRYAYLKRRLQLNQIKDLELQPRFTFTAITGRFIRDYKADFRYFDIELNKVIVEDVKGFISKDLQLLKRMFEACYDDKLQYVLGKKISGGYSWENHEFKRKLKTESSHKGSTGTFV